MMEWKMKTNGGRTNVKQNEFIVRALALVMLAAVIPACVPGKQLLAQAALPNEVSGSYTLLLYGCHYPSQPNNVAILVKEDSRYPLEIFDIDASYRVKKGVPAQEALAEANAFVRCSTHTIWMTELKRIPDDAGGTVGFELRPLYVPLEFGFPDVMLISYALKDGRVRAYIRMDRHLERDRDSRDFHDSGSSGK
jgi:hypothetical protein